MAYGYCQVYYDGSYPYLDIRRDRAKWIIYAGGMVSISLTLGIGLWLVRDKKEKGK